MKNYLLVHRIAFLKNTTNYISVIYNFKKAKEKPFPVKSRRQEKASDAVISRRVGFALVQHDSAIVRTSSDCARCLGLFLPLTFPLAVDLRFGNHQFIILLIISDSPCEVCCLPVVYGRHIYASPHELMYKHLVVNSTHGSPSVIVYGAVKILD